MVYVKFQLSQKYAMTKSESSALKICESSTKYATKLEFERERERERAFARDHFYL